MTPKEFAKKIIQSINPGTADISDIGDGTIKGAICEQNKNKADKSEVPSLGWELVKSATGATSISLPSSFNELLIEIRSSTDCLLFNLCKNQLSSSRLNNN